MLQSIHYLEDLCHFPVDIFWAPLKALYIFFTVMEAYREINYIKKINKASEAETWLH